MIIDLVILCDPNTDKFIWFNTIYPQYIVIQLKLAWECNAVYLQFLDVTKTFSTQDDYFLVGIISNDQVPMTDRELTSLLYLALESSIYVFVLKSSTLNHMTR